jgi:hypothetical protein
VQVFKLYGEWVGSNATDAQLRQAVVDIRRRGMALAVEVGPLEAPSDCGQAVEGFAGKEEGLRIASRIAAGQSICWPLTSPTSSRSRRPQRHHWPGEDRHDVGAYIAPCRQRSPA